MGATTFTDEAIGSTPQEAFAKAREQALYQYGHSGYTGSIAEKGSFTIIRDTPEQVAARYGTQLDGRTLLALQAGDREAIPHALIAAGDSRIDDKWGPAGCIELGPKRYLFFGWASE